MASSQPTIVLASGSPRRRELLKRLGLPFVVKPPAVEEERWPGEDPPATARRLAGLKARAAAGEWVVAADTIVELNGLVLGKPRDTGENLEYLRLLSGRTHLVHTGLAVTGPDGGEETVSTTRVTFRELADWEMQAYAASGEGLDKAGGYGIQEKGMALVAGIEGDFFTVMGLPVSALWTGLGKLGYPLAEVWRA